MKLSVLVAKVLLESFIINRINFETKKTAFFFFNQLILILGLGLSAH